MIIGDISRPAFRVWFTLATFLSLGIIPTMLYTILLDQWGSNPVWGSIYGIGWCLATEYYEILGPTWVMGIGVIWALLMMPGLCLTSGWLWDALSVRGRKRAFLLLLATLCVMLPGQMMLDIWQFVHLPDLQTHFATVY